MNKKGSRGAFPTRTGGAQKGVKGSSSFLATMLLMLFAFEALSQEVNSHAQNSKRAFASWECAYLAKSSVSRATDFEPLFEQGLELFAEIIEHPSHKYFVKENSDHVPLGILRGIIEGQEDQFKLGYLWAFTIDWTGRFIETEVSTDTDESREKRRALLAEQQFLRRNCSLILLDR